MLIAMPRPARAGGLFDFLFGGFQRQSPPANVNSYAEPPAAIGRVAPATPSGTEDVRQGNGAIGRTVAFLRPPVRRPAFSARAHDKRNADRNMSGDVSGEQD